MGLVNLIHQKRGAATLPMYGRIGTSQTARVFGSVSLLAFCILYGAAFALVAPYALMPFAIPIIIAGSLVVWALPKTIRPPTRILEVIFAAFFIFLIIWPEYIAIALPGLPWITMTRLFGFPLFVIFAICLSVSSDFRTTLKATLNSAPLLWKTALAFAVLQLASIFFSKAVGYSIDKFISAQISWTTIFFVSCYVFLNQERAEAWAKCLWAMAIVVAIIGLVEYSNSRVPWAGHIPEFLKIEDESVIRALQGSSRSSTGIYRVQSTFGTALGLAEYIALTIPFILHFGTYGRQSFFVKLASISSLALLLFIAIKTDSRIGVVGYLLTFLLYPLIWAIVERSRNRQSIIASAVFFAYPAIFCTAVAATFASGRIHALVWGNGAQQASTDSRIIQYTKGLSLIFSHPLGYGIGMGAQTLGFYEPSGLLTIDTYYIAVALEYGVVGFLAYYGMIAASIYYAGKGIFRAGVSAREMSLFIPLLISLVNFVVIKSVFSQQDNHPLVFMMMGAIVALSYRLRGSPVEQLVVNERH